MFKKQKIKSKSGITLVALVVTIVVLLILAGVSLNLVIGNDGIIRRAKEAQERYRQASENEQKDLELAADYIDEMISGIEKINGVPIPNGYYYVGGTKNTGLVISDESSDENKYKTAEDGKVLKDDLVGNQWVWVPVDDVTKLCDTSNTEEYKLCGTTDADPVKTKLYSSSKSAILSKKRRTTPGTTSDYREPDLVVGSSGPTYDAENYKKIVGENGTLKEMAELFKREYETMIKSIEKYGGFYIGRYELSGTVDNPTEKKGTTITSKTWYELYNACKKIGAKSDGSDKEGIATRMIWGCQWDATCDFIATKGEQKSITDSREWGNYGDSTEPANTGNYVKNRKKDTGSNEAWKANNIYDIAGNCYEWTQEADDTSYRACRGGLCYNSGSFAPASYRVGHLTTDSDNDVGRFSSHFNNYYWNLERGATSVALFLCLQTWLCKQK